MPTSQTQRRRRQQRRIRQNATAASIHHFRRSIMLVALSLLLMAALINNNNNNMKGQHSHHVQAFFPTRSTINFSQHQRTQPISQKFPLYPRQLPSNTQLLLSYYVAPNEDDEEMIKSILGPMGNLKKQTGKRPRARSIVIMSDTTGVTAKSAVEKGLAQFNGCDERFAAAEEEDPCELLQKSVYPFLRTPQEIQAILEKATRDKDCLVVFTFADPAMRECASQLCLQSKLEYVDLLGPMYDVMTDFFGRPPMGMANVDNITRQSSRRELTELYYSQVDAIEFTLKADDGMAPWLLPEADVILVGVSRTGKTPLSVFLSQSQGLKVSNIPLVLELDPPPQLLADNNSNIDPQRVFCLTLNPIDLQRIREARLERELEKATATSTGNYADWDYLKKDIAKARRLAEENGWTEIDVTGRAVEETASLISSILNERFPTIDLLKQKK